jgi:hypothetical protein
MSLPLGAPSAWRRPGSPEAHPKTPRSTALVLLGVAVAMAFLASSCKRVHPTNTQPLDQAGLSFRAIEELRALDITDAEVAELVKARQADLSDAGCIDLVRLARARKQPFDSGDAVADLRRVDVSEPAILELAHLNQFGLWVGEAQAIRLSGLSDQVLLALARRRAQGQTVLSGPSLTRLKNAGRSEAAILRIIENDTSDDQVADMIAAERRAAAHTGFVRQRGRRR